MSFPANPTNGQLATVNGLVYTYNSTVGAWRITTQNQSTSLTINGTTININGSATITAATPNTLTRGTYLTGSNFNGSVATTWAVDATSANTASKVVARDANGDFTGRYLYSEYLNMSHAAGNRTTDTVFYSSNDAFIRKNDAAGMRTSLAVLALAGGQMTGTITGVTGTPVSFAGGTCISTDYNYILSGGNDTGNKAVMFVNGSARTADGGANGLTFRNDAGPLTLGTTGQVTNLSGSSLSVTGTTSPSASNTYDLGTASLRWRNIYTNDLQLSNGIGDYTIVEGAEDLFLYNNKTGKTFKFALIEVDPSIVPPKAKTS